MLAKQARRNLRKRSRGLALDAVPRLQRKPIFPAEGGKRVGPFTIQGKRASDLEYTCYLALKALGWTEDQIEFQVATLGGKNPGGAMIDFVVWAPAGPIVIEVNGDIWHIATEAQRQHGRVREAAIEEAWGGKLLYFELGTGDLTPDAVAIQNLLRLVGRGGGV